jgi:hypothetical protein
MSTRWRSFLPGTWVQERPELPGEHGGAEPPEVAADDDRVGSAPKRDHPAAAGAVAVVLLLVDLDTDLVAAGAARA